MIKFLISLMILTLGAMQAQAYIDPGTGSLVIQATIAVVVSSLVAIKMFWKKIKIFFAKITGKPIPQTDDENE